ncbi:energy transducer TonB [Apibacter raozihei]|uniref:energy transducer TonB n=1 Tax=Apibacter raozihei TaxID=2500547 RepID=UPI000FE3D109|nr:energy transducer TonB [Apibacter raozihei]
MLRSSSLKTVFFIAFLMFMSSYSLGQKSTHTTDDKIFKQNEVSTKAEFEGGYQHLLLFLSTNLKYPTAAVNSNIQGKVIVRFVVENNGTISNIKIIQDIGGGCGEEVVRVLQKTQSRWNSAKRNKKRVRSYYQLSILFKIPTDHSQPYIKSENLN